MEQYGSQVPNNVYVQLKAELNLLERTEMRMLRWMMVIKRIEKIRNEDIRARADVLTIWKNPKDRKAETEVE